MKATVSLAERFGLSALLVSLVIVGFGTSAPELLVSLQAALSGSPDIAVGNVLGSNIANVLLIAGAAAILFPLTLSAPGSGAPRGAVMLVASSLAVAAILPTGEISCIAGFVMFAGLVSYLVFAYLGDRAAAPAVTPDAAAGVGAKPLGPGIASLVALGGIALLMAGPGFLWRERRRWPRPGASARRLSG